MSNECTKISLINRCPLIAIVLSVASNYYVIMLSFKLIIHFEQKNQAFFYEFQNGFASFRFKNLQ